MSLEGWLAFVAATLVMGLIPGPGVVSIVGYAVSSGHRVALVSVAGLALGNVLAMSLSLAGVGVILAASALAFAILKWAGAAYLVGLGIVTILRSKNVTTGDEQPPIGARTAFLGNAAIGTFHPKTIVFFVAFVPQFISPYASYVEQSAVLIATFCGVLAFTDTVYALAASRAGALLRGQAARRWAARAGGGFLIASGVATAAIKR